MAKKAANKRAGNSPAVTPERFMREKARKLPMGKCYATSDWQQTGGAHVLVTRVRPSGNLTVGSFVVDCQCLGVKEAGCYLNISPEQFAEQLEKLGETCPLEEIAYPEVHNMIYGAIEFAQEGGIVPAKGFALARYVLEEDTDDVPLIDYEFGKSGKHNLRTVGLSAEDVARYKALLEGRLGDDFTVESRMSEAAPADCPKEVYAYRHPEYPATIRPVNQFIADELLSADNYVSLPDEVVARILALPADEAAADLAQVILYETGRTYRGVANGSLDTPDNSAIFHALLLLSHIDSDQALGALLLLMCQSAEFVDFHLSDYAFDLIYPALYMAGRHRLSDIEAYVRRPGLDSCLRSQAVDMMALTAMLEPARRQEMIEVMRRWLEYIAGNISERKGCDGDLAGFLMANLIDMSAEELLPEIKAVFDTGCVNDKIAGDYDRVVSRIAKRENESRDDKYKIPDIGAIYGSLREAASHDMDV